MKIRLVAERQRNLSDPTKLNVLATIQLPVYD